MDVLLITTFNFNSFQFRFSILSQTRLYFFRVIQPAVLDANWFYFEKLCTSLQWRKLSTHQHLNLSSNPYYWMHSLLSNTLQRNPPAGHVLLPFLIFFSAICLGHKLIRSVSLRRVFTHDRPPLRSAYHQKPTHIQICHSRLEWLSNPLSLAVRCVCVSFCGGGRREGGGLSPASV